MKYHYFRKGEKSTINDYDMRMVEFLDKPGDNDLLTDPQYAEAYIRARETDIKNIKECIKNIKQNIKRT